MNAFSDSFVAPVSYLRSYRLAAAASWGWGRNPLELHDNLPPETHRRGKQTVSIMYSCYCTTRTNNTNTVIVTHIIEVEIVFYFFKLKIHMALKHLCTLLTETLTVCFFFSFLGSISATTTSGHNDASRLIKREYIIYIFKHGKLDYACTNSKLFWFL